MTLFWLHHTWTRIRTGYGPLRMHTLVLENATRAYIRAGKKEYDAIVRATRVAKFYCKTLEK